MPVTPDFAGAASPGSRAGAVSFSGGSSEDIVLGAGVVVRNAVDVFDYFSNSWTVIGLKDHPDGTRISPAGEFLLADGSSLKILVGEAMAPLDNRVRKALIKGYLPIVQYHFILNGAVECAIEAFVCPSPGAGAAGYDFPADGNFVNMVRVTLTNRTSLPADAAFGLGWKGPAPITVGGIPGSRDKSLTAAGALLATFSVPEGADIRTDGRRLEFRTAFAPGKRVSYVFRVPFRPLVGSASSAAALGRLEFEDWEVRTAAAWEGLLNRGARLFVPEEKVLYSYLASLVNQFIGRDRAELHAGEGFYDEFYLRDGSYQAVSLAQAGFLDEARQSLELFPRHQRENGQFVSQAGELDANGYAVWALVEFGQLTGDNIWTWKLYPAIKKALDFARSARAAEKDPQSPFFGILPKAPADGENLWPGNNHIVGYDWWNLRAVQSAAEAARLLAQIDEKKAFEAEFETYRRDILKALDRTGLPWIPPSYEKEGTHWGNLEVIFPTPLLEPFDRRVTATLDEVRSRFGGGEGSRPGFIEGVIQWTPKTGAIHPYMSLFVTNSHIVRGEQNEAVDGFYSFLLHSTSTQGFPEGVYYAKREAWSDTLPHLWAAALYVTTLRNMLVREEGQDLHLFSAVPSAWLEPGKSVVFENAPTHFGRMSMSLEAKKDAITVRFTRPDRIDPERVVVHLPPDLEITGIVLCGKSVKMRDVRDILIPGWNLKEGNIMDIRIRRKSGVPHPDFQAKMAEYLGSQGK